jgi:hypothetical protein
MKLNLLLAILLSLVVISQAAPIEKRDTGCSTIEKRHEGPSCGGEGH